MHRALRWLNCTLKPLLFGFFCRHCYGAKAVFTRTVIMRDRLRCWLRKIARFAYCLADHRPDNRTKQLTVERHGLHLILKAHGHESQGVLAFLQRLICFHCGCKGRLFASNRSLVDLTRSSSRFAQPTVPEKAAVSEASIALIEPSMTKTRAASSDHSGRRRLSLSISTGVKGAAGLCRCVRLVCLRRRVRLAAPGTVSRNGPDCRRGGRGLKNQTCAVLRLDEGVVHFGPARRSQLGAGPFISSHQVTFRKGVILPDGGLTMASRCAAQALVRAVLRVEAVQVIDARKTR